MAPRSLLCVVCLMALAAGPLVPVPFTPTLHAAEIKGLAPNSAAAEIYGFDHLKTLGQHTTLVYEYRLEGRLMEDPFSDEIVLDLKRTQDGSNHAFDVGATLFAQGAARDIGPIVATTINPLLLIFFQRDVNQMSRGTGGATHYFRNVIRHAMAVPGQFRQETVLMEVAGRAIDAYRITFTPFVTDTHQTRMQALSRKSYSVTVSAAVPGGLVALETETPASPDTSGEGAMLRESYRFKEARP